MSATGCANGAVVLDGPDGAVKDGLVLGASCRMWTCPDCGPTKARDLKIRLVKALSRVYDHELAWLKRQQLGIDLVWRPFKLLTLTVAVRPRISAERYHKGDWRARPDEAERARHDMLRAWNRLHSWLRWLHRNQRDSEPLAEWEGANSRVPYFWVVQYTKRGWPHLHIILLWRDRITQANLETISRLWAKYGLGII